MGPLSNVAKAGDIGQQPPPERPRRRSAPRAHSQVPSALLDSPDVGAVAVVLWTHYEALMAPGIDGGRVPARARRKVMAEALGTSTTVVDDARRELLAEGPGGAERGGRGAKPGNGR